ncbi:hypothetical protein IFO70_38220 [Phormidium tenue FACHB-886]|nr:hypothetical protein [Phormidium tenue FACHB-886]
MDRGTAKNDRLEGTDDLLPRLQQHNALRSKAGNGAGRSSQNALMGGAGDDTLIAGSGANWLTGGAGRDRFVLTARSRANAPGTHAKRQKPTTITDFENGHDWIQLSGRLRFKHLIISQGRGSQKRNTLIRDRLTGEVLLILKGVNYRNIDQNDFHLTPVSTPISTSVSKPSSAPTSTSSNTFPTVKALSAQTLEEDVATTIAFTIADAETPVDSLVVTVSSPNTTLFPSANLALGNSGTTRTLSLTPAPNQSGSTTITVSVSDGTTTTRQNFDLTVNAVNDAPVNSVPVAQTVGENTPLSFSTANGNAISIQDADAADQPIQVTLTATQGTLSLASTSGLSFMKGDGTADTVLTLTGTLADINAALNGLRFDPTPDFDGNASVQIATSDQGNTGTGGIYSDVDSININIAHVPAEIRGWIWNDVNANAAQDSGETGLANRIVFLDDNQNGFLEAGERFTTTDADGCDRGSQYGLRGLQLPKRPCYLHLWH